MMTVKILLLVLIMVLAFAIGFRGGVNTKDINFCDKETQILKERIEKLEKGVIPNDR